MRRWLFACLLCLILTPLASAASVENPTNLSINHAIPFLVAFRNGTGVMEVDDSNSVVRFTGRIRD